MSENKEPSQRQLRVGQEVRKILASMVDKGEIHNLEGIDALVTLTKVHVSPDLKYAAVYVMTTNGESLKEVLNGLQLAANYLRKQVGARLQLRYSPELVFKADDSFERVDQIEKLLRDPKVQRDLKAEL